MKWHELEKRLRAAGCTLENGRKHILVRDSAGRHVLTLPHSGKAGAADYHRKLRGKLRRIEAEHASQAVGG